MKFSNYDMGELQQCGAAFVNALRAVGNHLDSHAYGPFNTIDPTKLWTEYVLDWFAATAADGMTVDAGRRRPDLCEWTQILKQNAPPSRDTRGEFLVDLAHTTFPDYQKTPYNTAYYETAINKPCKIRLALESEWGSAQSVPMNFHRVLEDAAKLTAMRADVKVMTFGIGNEDARKALVAALERLRRQAEDNAPWLWVAVPHRVDTQGAWAPTSGHFPL